MKRWERLIRNFTDRIEKEDVNLHGFLLSVRGRELAKGYYAPFREGQPHRMYSVSKTMTGIAVGMLADQGKLNLNDPVIRFFPDCLQGSPDERLARLTIRDMLRMATCFRSTAYREGLDENWTKPFFTVTPTHEPGTVFHYDTGCSQVLASLVLRLSGLEVIDFLNEKLWDPLGCTDRRFWLRDPSGSCQGGTGLCMSLRDLHRTALCVARSGEGLIPAWYLEEMTRKQIDTVLQSNEEERYGYGWQCWQTRAGWSMYGLGGQMVICCPKKNAVLSTIGDTRLDPTGVQRIYDIFFEELYPFLDEEDVLNAEPAVLELETFAVPDDPRFGLKESPLYVAEWENMLNLKSLRLEKNCLIFENARGKVRLSFGRGKNTETAYPGWPDVPALVSGGWLSENLLRVRCFAVGNAPCGFDMALYFREDTVTVQSRKSDDPVTEGYEGVATLKRSLAE